MVDKLHILNSCSVALSQGRLTWRHDNILHYISKCLDKIKFECYIDIPGHQTVGGETLKPELAITPDRPDIVIMDRKQNSVHILELSCSFEMNTDDRHTHKTNKYAYLLTDITTMKPTVTAFEIGSRGFITTENRNRLKQLHKFFKKGIKFSKFIENISAISVNSSYYIFLNRKEQIWVDPPPLEPPFGDGSK